MSSTCRLAVISADAELASVLARRHVEDIGKEIARATEEQGGIAGDVNESFGN
jgi:hypothetical protein